MKRTFCEYSEHCQPFLERVDRQGWGWARTSCILRSLYCNDAVFHSYNDCARHIVFEALGEDKVPVDLRPERVTRAKEMIVVGMTV